MSKKLIYLVSFAFVLSVAGSVSASTFVLDEFDDGDMATNTSGVGSGFEVAVRNEGSVTEADGLVTILGGNTGASRNQIGSKESFSANDSPVFGIFTITDMYREQSIDNGTARFYAGFCPTLPNFQGPVENSVDGLWIVVHSRYNLEGINTWDTGDGGLVYIDGGVVTVLSRWAWDSSVFTFDTASGLRSDRVAIDMIAPDLTFVLSSDAEGYSLNISSTDRKVVLPDAVSGTWAAAGVTNDLSEVYASVWTQGACPDNELGLVLDSILVNEEGWGAEFPFALSPKPREGTMLEATWVNLSWRAGDFALSHDVYFGEDFDDVNDGAEGTFVGNQAVTKLIVGFPGFAYPDGLVPSTTYYWRIDEVNDTEPNSPWKGSVWSFSIAPNTAYNPNPADGAESVDPDVELSWTVGFGAKLHTVYFGDNFDDVNNDAGGFPQSETTYTPGPLKLAKTYYWRVDEFDGIATYKGDVWSFTTQGAVGNPNPSNGAVDVEQTPVLTWTPGVYAASHQVYFGTDKDTVKNANTDSPEYKGTRNLGSESYDPGKLPWDTTYYWRVNEVNNLNPESPWVGNVWSFTTADFLGIEDFEDYNDYEPDRIFETWIDGWGVETNGSEVGYAEPNFPAGEHHVETTIVHGGYQSMPYFYENNFKYSEAAMTLVSARDWTKEGVGVLSLWFYGDASNAAERMYVALNGIAVVYHDNPDAALIEDWMEWTIDLQDFAAQGVNLANVNTISIGFGDKNNLRAGGSGLVFFDDIRLYRPAPEPELEPVVPEMP